MLQVGSLLIGAISKGRQQSQQNKQLDEMVQRTQEGVYQDTNYNLDLLNWQQQQLDDATNQRLLQRQTQALKDRSMIMVSAGEANVGGSSVARLMTHYDLDSALDQSSLLRNLEGELQASALQGMDMMRQGQSKINQAKTSRNQNSINNPYLNSFLEVAPSVGMLYMNHRSGASQETQTTLNNQTRIPRDRRSPQ